MGDEMIWVSRALYDSTLVKMFDSGLFTSDPERFSNAIKRNNLGEALSANNFPSELFARYKEKKFKSLPNFFMAGDWPVASAAFVGELQHFDTGNTSFYPVRLLQHDRKTPVEGDYFCLNFGETKTAFDPDKSPKARPADKWAKITTAWRLPFDPKHGDIAVSRCALEGIDLWLDTRLQEAIFLSDPLVKALKTAKLTRRLGLSKCRLI